MGNFRTRCLTCTHRPRYVGAVIGSVLRLLVIGVSMYNINGIRLSHGSSHEHIVRVWWADSSSTNAGNNSTQELVTWIEQGGRASVVDPVGRQANVGVVSPANGRPKYLRTYADGVWTDNLLSLPQR
jgi:hypothetical protein